MRLFRHIGLFIILNTILGKLSLLAQIPTIVTNDVSTSTACAGSTISVSFTASNLINPAKRQFVVQLSNIGGTFANPTSLSTGQKSPISVTLPASAIGGDYRLRVIADTTGVTYAPSAVFMMLKRPTVALTGDTTINVGGSATLSLFFSGNGPWTYTFTNTNTGTTSSNPLRGIVQPTVTTTYALQSVSNICGTGTVSGSAKVTVIPRITTDFTAATICAGATISVPFTLTGSFETTGVTYTAQLSNAAGSFDVPINIGTGNVSPVSGVLPTNLTAGTGYRIRIVASAVSTTVMSNSITIKPLPTAVLSGGASITVGENTNLSIAFTGDAPWVYKLSNNQTGTAITTPTIISVNPSITTTYTLQSISNTCGNGTVSGSALITVIPRISVAEVALGSVCVGTNISLPFVVTGSFDRTARLWDVNSGREVHRFEGHSGSVNSIAISFDGRYVVTGSDDKTARLWKLDSGREVRRFNGHSSGVNSVTISANGEYVLTGSRDNTARLWETRSGREVRRFDDKPVALSPDGKSLITGGVDGIVRLWEIGSEREVRRFEGVKSVSFSSDSKRMLTANMDSTTRLWDTSTGAELCSLISFQNGTWAVVDSQGRYDASNSGEIEGLHWVVGNESIDLVQLKQRYYDPGLLAKILGYNKEPRKNVAEFRDVKLHPAIEAAAPAPDSNTLHLKLTNRGGGIGRVVVKVNGKEIVTDARGPRPDPAANQVELNVSLVGAPIRPGQPNEIEVIAYNGEGWLASRSSKVVWDVPAARKEVVQPNLYAIVVGISEYANPSINLRYAAKDAGDMAQALTLGARQLFGAEKVHLQLLTTADNPFATTASKPAKLKLLSPTKENLRAAFAEVAQAAKPDDILVIYFAGHGITVAGVADLYAFPTREAQTLDSRALSDPAVREHLWRTTLDKIAEFIDDFHLPVHIASAESDFITF